MAKTPQITLTDPHTKKSATLDDPQAVRVLLLALVERLDADYPWTERLPDDPTEAVACQILRKAGSLAKADLVIRGAETLAALFSETSLAEDAKVAPSKGDGPVEQKPLNLDEEQDAAVEDVRECLVDLWPDFKRRVELGEGEQSQTVTIKVTWYPPTENRDGYVGTSADMTVKGKRVSRTGRVSKRKGKGGGYQLALFDRGDE